MSGTDEARAEAAAVARRLRAARAAVERAGVAVEIVSGAGSGNYVRSATLRGVNEVQAGGGCLFCQTYENAFDAAAGGSVPGAKPLAGAVAAKPRRCLFMLVQVVSVKHTRIFVL